MYTHMHTYIYIYMYVCIVENIYLKYVISRYICMILRYV